jgi:ABC-type antimicrobial peptide transport system permease subunit
LKEAIALSLSGAGIGIGLVAICAKIVNFFVKTDMQLTLSLQSIILGVGISVIVGLVFGAAPARTAARLSPVEAISGQKK